MLVWMDSSRFIGGSMVDKALARELFPDPGGPIIIIFGNLITGSYICG
jgi:hypothetical protein